MHNRFIPCGYSIEAVFCDTGTLQYPSPYRLGWLGLIMKLLNVVYYYSPTVNLVCV